MKPIWTRLEPGIVAVFAFFCLLLQPGRAGDTGVAAKPVIDVRNAAMASCDTVKARIPRVRDETAFWENATPLFELSDETGKFSARGWAALSEENFLLHIVVKVPEHLNNRTGTDIWNGDSVQVCLDTMPLAALQESATEAYANRFVGAVAFALAKDGPKAWAHHLGKIYGHGAGNPDGGVDRWKPEITRDDAAGVTTYQLRLPTREFGVPSGLIACVGLSVQVNHGCAPSQKRLSWGNGLKGVTVPGLNKLVSVEDAPGNEIFWAPARDSIWKANDELLFLASFPAKQKTSLKVTALAADREFEISEEQPTGRQLREIAVRCGKPPASPFKVSLAANLAKTGGGQPKREEFAIAVPSKKLDELAERIKTIKAAAKNPAARASLESILTAARHEWAELAVPERQFVLDNTEALIGHLDDSMADNANYISRLYQRMVAFPSKTPRAINFYKIRLPKGYQKDRAYPVIYELHGGGVQSLTQFAWLDLSKEQLDAFRSIPELADGEHYEVKLYAGKRAFLGDGSDMIWEQINHFEHSGYLVDADRRYLSGGSKGGYGTWSLGLRTPDRWAALAIDCGGFHKDDDTYGLARNANALPIIITHGDADETVPFANGEAMCRELRKWGNQPEFRVLPGVGHALTRESWMARNAWILGHVRKKPSSFKFVVLPGEDRYNTAWGVRLHPEDPAKPGEIECRASQDGKVSIHTTNVKAIDIGFGENGLSVLENTVEINWNGTVVRAKGQPGFAAGGSSRRVFYLPGGPVEGMPPP